MIKVVEQELGEGRVDVRRLVAGAVDSVVGREVGGVVLPKPLLSAAAVEWPAKQEEAAAEQAEAAAVQDEEAAKTAAVQAVKADEAPKAPADLIARVAASIKQNQKAKAESKRSSKVEDMIAKVLASGRKIKTEQAANESGWSGGGGRMLEYILEGMTL